MGAIFNAQANHTPLLVTAGQQVRAHDHDAGEPDQPRRDPDAAPARQVELRAAPRRRRPGGDRPRRSTPRRCRRRARPSSRSRWTTGPPRPTTTATAQRDRAAASAAAPSPRPTPSPHLAERLARAANPVLVAGPDIDASGGWDDAVALAERQRLPVWAIPATGGGRLGFPEGHPQLPGRPAAGDRPARRDARRPRPDPRRRRLGLRLLPLPPRRPAARGRRAGR